MYCSTSCMEYAEENYHNFECGITEILHKCGIMQMVMRIFFQALNMFNGSIEKMENFLKKYEKSSTSVYDFDFSTSDQNERAKNYLASMYCLARTGRKVDDSPVRIFLSNDYLSQIWNSHEKFITRFISRIIDVYDCNFHGICGWSRKKNENNTAQMIGVGCYPFASLINHSCYPNVNRIYHNDKMLIIVDRPIKKGEQLFDCYRYEEIIKKLINFNF